MVFADKMHKLSTYPLPRHFAKWLVSDCVFLFTVCLAHLSINQKIKILLHFLQMLIFQKIFSV